MRAVRKKPTRAKDREWVPPAAGEWTIDQFMKLETPPGYRYELIEGSLIMSPSPGLPHQAAVGFLYEKMSAYVRKHKLGKVYIAPLDVLIDEGETQTVVEPDILFVSNERVAMLSGGQNVQGAPDLLVEVLSPSSHRRDTRTKFDLYMSRGVVEYWIVDPAERTIAVWVRRGELFVLKGEHGVGGRAKSEVLAGFGVAVKEVCA